ncbi:hypothetical protein D3C81_492550 [compost metagenome]
MVETHAGIAGLVVIEKHRALGIGAQHSGAVLAITHVAAQRRSRAAGAGAGNQPARFRVLFETHLLEDRLGDVVVRPPVGRALGVGELVDEMPVVLTGQSLGFGVDLRRVVHQVALPAVKGDLRDLFLGRGCRHHRNERQAEHAREVRFGNRRRTAGRFNDRRSRFEPAVTQRIKKQRTRQPMLEAAGGMAGFILEVQLDARKTRQRQGDQVGVGAALEIGFDDPDRFAGPLSVVAHDGFLVVSGRSRPFDKAQPTSLGKILHPAQVQMKSNTPGNC